MISRPCIEVLAVLLCAAPASAQENRRTPEQRIPDATTRLEHCPRQKDVSGLGGACKPVFEPGTKVASGSK